MCHVNVNISQVQRYEMSAPYVHASRCRILFLNAADHTNLIVRYRAIFVLLKNVDDIPITGCNNRLSTNNSKNWIEI